MGQDPTMKIINEYLDENKDNTWDENREAIKVMVWLKERGYLRIGASYENQGTDRDNLGSGAHG